MIGRVKRDSASPLRPNNNFSSGGSVVIWLVVVFVVAVAVVLAGSVVLAGLDGCGTSCRGTGIVSLL